MKNKLLCSYEKIMKSNNNNNNNNNNKIRFKAFFKKLIYFLFKFSDMAFKKCQIIFLNNILMATSAPHHQAGDSVCHIEGFR